MSLNKTITDEKYQGLDEKAKEFVILVEEYETVQARKYLMGLKESERDEVKRQIRLTRYCWTLKASRY
ncbi:MAG: hypothetical protein ABH840_01985 [Nanoarchaeota archaeon]